MAEIRSSIGSHPRALNRKDHDLGGLFAFYETFSHISGIPDGFDPDLHVSENGDSTIEMGAVLPCQRENRKWITAYGIEISA